MDMNVSQHVLGCIAAIFAGLMYGTNFVPPQILIDRGEGSADGLDYVFSHFCGIRLASIFYFITYCIYMSALSCVRSPFSLLLQGTACETSNSLHRASFRQRSNVVGRADLLLCSQ